jgi:predicted RNase H-like nuclease (RuvC/YqgF family)
MELLSKKGKKEIETSRREFLKNLGRKVGVITAGTLGVGFGMGELIKSCSEEKTPEGIKKGIKRRMKTIEIHKRYIENYQIYIKNYQMGIEKLEEEIEELKARLPKKDKKNKK